MKEAKQKVLPELTDEWVDEASEFDTVDELRADIRKRLEMMQKLQAQMAVRDKVLEAAADLVPIAAPEALVDDETRRRVEDLAHRLSHQNATLEQYLAGDRPGARRRSSTRCAPGAARAVLADLALRAVVAQEAIERDRRRGRRRDRAPRRAARAEGRKGAARSRTEGRAGDGTL